MINATEAKPVALNVTLGDEPASELEKAQAIRDVMEHAVHMSQVMALSREMKSWPARPILLALLAVTSLAICAYTFIAEADWAYGPDPAQVSAVRSDAYLRFAMFLTAQRIEAVRGRTGELPATLEEVGADWPALRYQRADSVFTLRARAAGGQPIVLQSTDDLKRFLGDSRRQMREHR